MQKRESAVRPTTNPASSASGISPSEAVSAQSVNADTGKRKAVLGALAAILVLAGGVVAFVYLKPPVETVQQANKDDSSNAEKKDGQEKDNNVPAKDSAKEPPPKVPAAKVGKSLPQPKVDPKPKPFPKDPPKPFPSDPAKKKSPPKQNKDAVSTKKGNPPIVPNPVDPKPVNPIPEPVGPKPTPKDPPKPKPPVAQSEGERVNKAIDLGVVFLKKSQTPQGTWPSAAGELNVNDIGFAALAGLTLLECDVPPNDATVQRAAGFVRRNCCQPKGDSNQETYNISTAILFLDRLGDPRDRPLIQSLAIRLVAGQAMHGGWSYNCPVLSSQQMVNGYNALLRYRRSPVGFADPLGEIFSPPAEKKPTEAAAIWQKLKNLPYPKLPAIHVIPYSASQQLAKAYFTPNANVGKLPEWGNKAIPNVRLTLATLQSAPAATRPKLLRQVLSRPGFGPEGLMRYASDNSNSQFAMLGLWAARRHGVPTEHALRLAAIHYLVYQNSDGGWPYLDGQKTRGTMTGVGLLSLALGYGVAGKTDDKQEKPSDLKKAKSDPSIQFGLQTFAKFIDPSGTGGSDHGGSGPNLYFLWTVERVAVLYDLKTIGAIDWYRWGLNILLPNQSKDDGSWNLQGFSGSCPSIDTCFALLFLKRSNLVREVTENLRFFLAIDNPNAKEKGR